MRFVFTSGLLFLFVSALGTLEAASYCRVQHPDFYYQSQGRRLHGRFGGHHFRQYHPTRRAYRSQRPYYRDSYRRGRLYRGRSVYRPYVHPAPRRYYRRPGLSFHYHHGRRYGKGPRFGIHLDF